MFYTLRSEIHFNYILDGTNLQKIIIYSFKDLGITFEPKLLFINHIENIVIC